MTQSQYKVMCRTSKTKHALSPNRLQGHEGQLLMTLDTINARDMKCDFDESWFFPKNISKATECVIPPRKVVMYLSHQEDSYGNGCIQVLYDTKVLYVFIPLNSWMTYFIPWPRGAFIENNHIGV